MQSGLRTIPKVLQDWHRSALILEINHRRTVMPTFRAKGGSGDFAEQPRDEEMGKKTCHFPRTLLKFSLSIVL